MVGSAGSGASAAGRLFQVAPEPPSRNRICCIDLMRSVPRKVRESRFFEAGTTATSSTTRSES